MLAPGDSVRIVVWRKPEFSGDFVIAPDGTITHPLFRGVKAAGVPLRNAEASVRQFLLQFDQNPQFVMEPLIRVAVSGEVPRPMVFAVNPETSIAEAVARAGGTNQFGNRVRVRVIRSESAGAERLYYANLQDPADRGAAMRVRSGDQIVVDRKKNFFREVLLPAISFIGSVASIALLIDRNTR
jgi:polysaccharide export outer membrane protein